jgi:alpha-D-ribose 1-methylphosphonate 5-triphosphate diphosphatase PhnM
MDPPLTGKHNGALRLSTTSQLQMRPSLRKFTTTLTHKSPIFIRDRTLQLTTAMEHAKTRSHYQRVSMYQQIYQQLKLIGQKQLPSRLLLQSGTFRATTHTSGC